MSAIKKIKPKVLVAISGGVDSSVAAHIMLKEGFEVIGAFMKNWSDSKDDFGECRWREDREVASVICKALSIPLVTLDFEKEYRRDVVDEMFKLYKRGITPNPDVDCNQRVKFPLLWKAAKKLGCKFIVTGHYARIKKDKKGKFNLLRGKEDLKDQSYFLYRLSQNDLSHSLFPIGGMSKVEVRRLAKELKFPNFERPSTKGICFIGKVNLKDFLQVKIKPKKGNILSPNGEIIGEHDGISYYTIGQRIGPRYGIDISRKSGSNLNPRWYVAAKNSKKNIIVVAPQGHPSLLRKVMVLDDFHLITQDVNEWKKKLSGKSLRVDVRIRKVGELLPATIKYDINLKRFVVTLKTAVTGISEGQATVLYKKNSPEVLGGGVVSDKEKLKII